MKRLRGFRRSLMTMLCCLTMLSSSVASLSVYAGEEDEAMRGNYVTITYDVASLTNEDGETIVPGSVSPSKVEVDASNSETAIEQPEVSANDGYAFDGWQVDGDPIDALPKTVGDLSDEIIEAGDVTYTATFKAVAGDDDAEEPAEPEEEEEPTTPEDTDNAEEEDPVEVSDAVKAFIEAAESIDVPDEITDDNRDALVEQIGVANAAYNQLSDAEKKQDDVKGAYAFVESAQQVLDAYDEGAAEPQEANTEGVKVEVDGVQYTLTTNDDGTCTITKFGLPDGVTTSPETVNVPGTVTIDGKGYTVADIDNGWNASTPRFSNTTTLTLPNTLTHISNARFSQFKAITEIEIPGSVKKFNGNFNSCTALKKATFAEGIEEITCNGSMFSSTVLEEINLPSTLKTLNASFIRCSKLKSLSIPDGTTLGSNFDVRNCTSLTELTLPSTVTEIGANWFSGCTALKKVTANGTITKVSGGAFRDCTSLTEIPDLSAVTSIGASAFENCGSLNAQLDLSSVTTMGEKAFYNCSSLQSNVNLSSLDQIPAKAFSYAKVTVTAFSNNLTTIGEWAFIESTVAVNAFPDTLESIGNYAFYYSNFPTEFTLPDSLETVGTKAFTGANGVKTLHVGTNQTGLKSLATDAFSDMVSGTVYIAASKDEFTYKDSSIFTKVIYLYEAVDAENDKISNDADAMTLQEAVNAAAAGNNDGVNILDGGIVVLKKNVRLSKTLNVPAGKSVTIQSEDGSSYTIVGPKDSSIDNLVEVESGADITYKNVAFSGRYNKKSVMKTAGKITLGKDVTISNSTIKDTSTGVIDVNGSSASLVLNGATLKGNTITAASSATILVHNGASIDMQDGTIENNKYTENHYATGTSGILLTNGTSGKMSGGTISGNTSRRGAAIMLNNGGGSDRVTFEMSGGTISGNKGTNGDNDMSTGAGAVYIDGNAAFTMSGNALITNNASEDKGGGVTVVDWKLQNKMGDENTAFIMNGGTISNNTASSGGGIYSFANGTELHAGYITGNTATSRGGAIYVEGNSEIYSRTHMYNVIVANNTAAYSDGYAPSGIGGGLWLCPTGDAKVYIKNGGVLNGNTANRAGDDIAAAQSFNKKYSLTIANRIMGGGKVDWMVDGHLFGSTPSSPDPQSDGTNRYNKDADPAPKPQIVENSRSYQTLHSVITADDLANAEKQAKLFIKDNTAQQGGGIAINGGLTIGEANPIDIKVEKVWKIVGKGKKTDSITVQLTRDGIAYGDPVELSDENEWSYTWEKLEDGYEWSAEEVKVPNGFTASVEKKVETGLITLTLTNTDTPDTPPTPPENPPHGDSGDGDIHLYKIDGQTKKPIAGASFALYKSNGDYVGTYTTDADGHIGIKNLDATSYYFTEVKAPEGYTLDPTYLRFTVKADVEMNLKFTNNKTEVPTVMVGGTKTWVGDTAANRPDSITLHLYANGVEVGTAITNAAQNWVYTFGAQAVKDAAGNEIVYTVTEEAVSGYTTTIADAVKGDGCIVLNVTNTYQGGALADNSGAIIATGDDSHMMVYAGVMSAAVAGLAAWVILRRKKGTQE